MSRRMRRKMELATYPLALSSLAAQPQHPLMPMPYGPSVIDYPSVPLSRGSSRKAKQAARAASMHMRRIMPYTTFQTMSIPVTAAVPGMVFPMGTQASTQMSVNDSNWTRGRYVELMWDRGASEEFKLHNVMDIGSNSHMDDPLSTMKDHVVLFGDKVTDMYAEHLSPARCSGPIPLMVPAVKSYPTPMHYVEAMKMITAASPAMLMAGTTPQAAPGMAPLKACDIIGMHSDIFINQPSADAIRTISMQCNGAAKSAGWWKPETILCRFWLSLWIALWAKYSLYPAHMSVLLNTGKKMLIYSSTNTTYGVEESPQQEYHGVNATGMLLMLLRAMANKGWLSSRQINPIAVFDQHVKPILKTMLSDDGSGFPRIEESHTYTRQRF
jgi:hypothetical protein